jgi:hypothetical protein
VCCVCTPRLAIGLHIKTISSTIDVQHVQPLVFPYHWRCTCSFCQFPMMYNIDIRDCSCCFFLFRVVSARTSDSGASIGHLRDRRMGIKSNFSRPLQSQEQMLQAMLREVCVQHSNISRSPPSSLMLRPCCDYITTMLRATSNIRSFPSLPPQHKNQHHMSANI